MRLDTKEKRLAARQFYFREGEGMKVLEMPALELTAFVGDDPPSLCIFKGTAGKPYIYYRYRSIDHRDVELEKAIARQQENLAYKAKQREKNKGNLTDTAATAKVIKAHLKKEFPSVKFSVTSETFSMGNSVHIKWTDGPLQEAVERITNQYRYGRFNAMEDYAYTVDIDEEKLGCSGAKYISCRRQLSSELKAQIQEVLDRDFFGYHGEGQYAPFQWTEAEKRLLGIVDPEPEPEMEPEMVVDAPERTEPTKTHANVIDMTARLEGKKAREAEQKSIEKFMQEYMPFLTQEETYVLTDRALTNEEKMARLLAACLRIDMEKGQG